VLGGMGLTNEMRLTDAWHTIRIVRIAEGSSEIMRRTIARQLLKGDVSF
jgi:acyl-CoA dehydrogenase